MKSAILLAAIFVCACGSKSSDKKDRDRVSGGNDANPIEEKADSFSGDYFVKEHVDHLDCGSEKTPIDGEFSHFKLTLGDYYSENEFKKSLQLVSCESADSCEYYTSWSFTEKANDVWTGRPNVSVTGWQTNCTVAFMLTEAKLDGEVLTAMKTYFSARIDFDEGADCLKVDYVAAVDEHAEEFKCDSREVIVAERVKK